MTAENGQYPLVSVLMTSYNREKYIATAIESVLASTYPQFELIIVDDQSADATVEIAKSYAAKDKRVKIYCNEENLGDYPNRNKAASYAAGKYIKYLDSDDIMYPHCLQVMVRCMETFPDAGYGLCAVYDAKGPYPACLTPREAYLEHFNGFGHFGRAPGSSIIRKDAFDAVGGFTGRRMIGDSEMWFILSRSYPMVKIPRDLIWSRLHNEQESQSSYANNYQKLTEQVIKEALEHKDCPLSANEIEELKQLIRKQKIKSKIKRFIR